MLKKATLSYDRLGVGMSDHPDGTNIVQASYEIAQSISIANSVRSGNLSDIGAFQTLIGLGHCEYSGKLMKPYS